MQPSFFDVTPIELGQLGIDPAVKVLREMLWAEARIVGVPSTAIEVPSKVMTADGGVDATVTDAPKMPGNGLIFGPMTAYQVKSGPYSLTSRSFGNFEDLLIKKSVIKARLDAEIKLADYKYTADDINTGVRRCLDAGGIFVAVLFGDDNPEKDGVTPEQAIQKFLGKIDGRYANAKIKILRQSAICGLLRNYPGLSLRIKDQNTLPVISHLQWARNEDMDVEYRAAPEQEKVIDLIRSAVSEEGGGSLHIRLIGEPGIGKSRLVLEALGTPELKPLVLYAGKGTDVDGAVINAITSAPHVHVILVVDECAPDKRSELANRLGGICPNLKIISIYQDPEDGDRTATYRPIKAPELPREKIEEILAVYGVAQATIRHWADLCDGSPRVAHVVGKNLLENPSEPLKGDGLSMIWDRYLAGDVAPNSAEFERRKFVLSCLSLFKKFGWDKAVPGHAFEVFDNIVKEVDGTMSKVQFIGVIERMKGRKILQGDKVLYITPKALHIKLWTDWWAKYEKAIDVKDLIEKLSPMMRNWFGEIMEYAKASPILKPLVDELLGPTGLFDGSGWLNSSDGGQFFFNLSRSEPASALRCLERILGSMSLEELRAFDAGRRYVISALEDIALHGELFLPAARVLLSLAEAENESWTNNASGVFAELFSLGYGEVAPTSLAPEHRLQILTKAIAQGGARKELALKAFDTAFNLRSIGRWTGDSPFLSAAHVQRWLPKTMGEWMDAYRLYWLTLAEYLRSPDLDFRLACAKLLLSHLRELLSSELLHEAVLATVEEISALKDFDQRQTISEIELILTYDADGLPVEVVKQLESIVERLVGTSFSSRLKRFAGMDLLYDKIDKDGNEIDASAEEIRHLAGEALANPDSLRAELSWLVSDQAQNGYRFGQAIGKQDPQLAAWPDIRDAWFAAGAKAHDFFIGGYLQTVFARDTEAWERIIGEIAASGRNVKLLPGVIWRSGMTEGAAQVLLALAKAGDIEPRSLELFSAGQATKPISDGLFAKWLDYLGGLDTFEGAGAALHLASMSLMSGRKLSPEQIRRLVTLEALGREQEKRHNVMLSHHWLQLAKRLIEDKPEFEVDVLAFILDNKAQSGAVSSSMGPPGDKFFDELVSRRPEETWKLIEADIRPPMGTRGFVLTRWIRGDSGFQGRAPGPIRHIPREVFWPWIAEDPERRAVCVIGMAPKDFEPDSWGGSLVRELLVKFGENIAIRRAAFANFFTGGWHGPASAHYASQKHQLEKILETEADPTAQLWLREAIESTEHSIQHALIEEETRGF